MIYDAPPVEAPSPIREIVQTYPELQGLIRTGPEQTAEVEAEARRTGAPVEREDPIHRGDAVSIEVLGEPEFTVLRSVEVDGTIGYPLLGRLTLAGRQRNEVQAEIAERLKKYLREPRVIVNSITVCPLPLTPSPKCPNKVRVLGAVGTPGELQFEPRLRLSGAIALSGWFTDSSERREVWVIRPRGARRRASLVVCDFQALLCDGDMAQDVPLEPNDIVFVPGHSLKPPQGRAEWDAVIRYLTGARTASELRTALEGASGTRIAAPDETTTGR